eukprot:m.708037 g.708037  ORF g.708037 m.708037 type:complete len:111 (+) comp58737_c0_seq5:1498-1830(+)
MCCYLTTFARRTGVRTSQSKHSVSPNMATESAPPGLCHPSMLNSSVLVKVESNGSTTHSQTTTDTIFWPVPLGTALAALTQTKKPPDQNRQGIRSGQDCPSDQGLKQIAY